LTIVVVFQLHVARKCYSVLANKLAETYFKSCNRCRYFDSIFPWHPVRWWTHANLRQASVHIVPPVL